MAYLLLLLKIVGETESLHQSLSLVAVIQSFSIGKTLLRIRRIDLAVAAGRALPVPVHYCLALASVVYRVAAIAINAERLVRRDGRI
jgi:hypothetical protein